MILHEPFIIGPRLLPALQIGEAILSLTGVEPGERTALGRRRLEPRFVLDIAGKSYEIGDMQSGAGGFDSLVEPFEMLLSFMAACAESIQYRQRTGMGGDNAELFEPDVAQWCADNASAIEGAQCEIADENGEARHELIEP